MAVNVITNSQLQAMRDKISLPKSSEKAKYLQALHENSKKKAESWPNTLEAQRVRKDRARKERAAALEAVRQQQDRDVAYSKECARRRTLERVNKMIFQDTDSAKEFHSAALHCDVLAERAAQIELKQQIRALRSAQEEAFARQMSEQVELAEDAELSRLQQARDRAIKQRDAQLEQLEEVKRKVLAQRAENRLLGEELKRRAIAEEQDTKEKEAAMRRRSQEAVEATARANEALREFKMKEAELEAASEKARVAYLAGKERLMATRKAKEAEKAAREESRRQEMLLVLYEYSEMSGEQQSCNEPLAAYVLLPVLSSSSASSPKTYWHKSDGWSNLLSRSRPRSGHG